MYSSLEGSLLEANAKAKLPWAQQTKQSPIHLMKEK